MTTADSRAMLLLRWGLQLVIEAGQLQGEYPLPTDCCVLSNMCVC